MEVIYTDEFGDWFGGLDTDEQEAVGIVVDLLADKGVALGSPHSSALKGTGVALRELRPKSGSSPIRVIYAFDPQRDAVLIIGGDKSGDNKFYKRLIPKAERIWQEYLQELVEAKKKEQS